MFLNKFTSKNITRSFSKNFFKFEEETTKKIKIRGSLNRAIICGKNYFFLIHTQEMLERQKFFKPKMKTSWLKYK
jgi:hypothetical protein